MDICSWIPTYFWHMISSVRLFHNFAGSAFRGTKLQVLFLSGNDSIFENDSTCDRILKIGIFPLYIKGIPKAAHIVWLIWPVKCPTEVNGVMLAVAVLLGTNAAEHLNILLIHLISSSEAKGNFV